MSSDVSRGRRSILKTAGLAIGGMVVGSAQAQADTVRENAVITTMSRSEAEMARRAHNFKVHLDKMKRNRNFKSLPMILTNKDQWDSKPLEAVIDYDGGTRIVVDAKQYFGPWLNLMRNTLNAQQYSFGHKDALVVSATHGSAALALYDDYIWDKYQIAKILSKGAEHPITENILVKATHLDTDPFAENGIDSPLGDTIPVLQERGVVFMTCHNQAYEFSAKLIKAGINPDKKTHDELVAELSNHLIPGVIMTPGIVATIIELEKAGFQYLT